MTGVVITMSGDDARLQAALNRSIANQDKFLAKLKEVAAGGKKLSEEEIAMIRKKQEEEVAFQRQKEVAKKIIADLTTVEQKYAAKVKEANDLHAKGLLTSEQLTKQLRKAKEQLTEATDNYGKKNASVADDFKGQVEDFVAGYLTIRGSISAVNKLLEDQANLQKENAENVDKIGKAQAAAGQNFVGLTDEQKVQAQTIGLRAQKQSGFPERAILEKTAGEVFGATPDLAVVEDATTASARLNRLTPENVTPMATGAADLVQATGIKNAEQNMSLILSTQKLSRVATPVGVSKNLPVVTQNAQSALPEQNQQDITKEVASTYGAFTQRLVDSTGDVSKTAVVEMNRKIDDFFSKAGEKLSETTIKINELKGKIAARAKERKPADESDAADLKKLEEEQAALSNLKDPQTYFGRIRSLQQNQSAAKMLLATPFGPGEASGYYKQLLTDPESEFSKQVFSGKAEVDMSEKTYDETIRQQRLTPEQRLASETARNNAEIELRRSRPELKAKDEIARVTTEGLRDSRMGNIYGLANPTFEYLNEQQVRSAGTVEESARIADEALKKRASDLQQFRFSGKALTMDEVEKLRNIEEARRQIRSTQSAYNENPFSGVNPNVITVGPETGQGRGSLFTPEQNVNDPRAPLDPFSGVGGKKPNNAPPPQVDVKVETKTTLDSEAFSNSVSQFTNAVNRMMNMPRTVPSVAAARAQAAAGTA